MQASRPRGSRGAAEKAGTVAGGSAVGDALVDVLMASARGAGVEQAVVSASIVSARAAETVSRRRVVVRSMRDLVLGSVGVAKAMTLYANDVVSKPRALRRGWT